MQTAAEMTAMLEHDEEHWWYRGGRRAIRAELDRLPLRPDHEAPVAAEARWLAGGGRLTCGLSLLAVLRKTAR